MVLLIDSEIQCNAERYFNKHKSWYKLDVEGSFITRNYFEETVTPKPKAVKTAKKMSRKTTKNINKFEKPAFLKFPHDTTVTLAANFGLFILGAFLFLFAYAFLELIIVKEIVEDYAKDSPNARFTKLQLLVTSPQVTTGNFATHNFTSR